MKKLVIIAIAAIMMAFSVTSAFAVSVDSPVATTQSGEPDNEDRNRDDGSSNVNKPDGSSTSPKTGSADVLAYSLIALSAVGCGAASVALVKASKKN